MVEVVFVFRGRTVTLEDVENAKERAALRVIEKSIRDRVGALRCAEHQTFPRVTATGSSVDALEFDLAGCCDSLLSKAAARFE